MHTHARRRPSPEFAAAPQQAFQPAIHCFGRIVAISDDGRASVEFDGNCAGPLTARSAVQLSNADAAALRGAPVVLGFEGCDTSRPVILGVVQDRLLLPPPSMHAVARVDGRRLQLTASDEISLRCGRASVTLRADGTILIKGGEVATRASGRNRVTGSTVAIN